MKTYEFINKDEKIIETRKCSQKEAKVYAHNFDLKYQEKKRNGR